MGFVMPPFPESFSKTQLDALRDLMCYALGHRSRDRLFPLGAPNLMDVTEEDINKFKSIDNRLDYDRKKDKIRAIYTGVFNFLNEDGDDRRYHNMYRMIDIVYPQHRIPPFPEGFSVTQLDALRDLMCYAVGHKSYKYLFPENGSDDLIRPSDDDVRAFKAKSAKLDFEGSQEKIKTIYTRVFEFMNESISTHQNMRHLFDVVYPSEEVDYLGNYGRFVNEFFKANSEKMRDYVKASRGVYILYRYGERAATSAELVKSVLKIYGRGTSNTQWLEFRLVYRGGRLGESGSKHFIDGVIFATSINLYFLGIDHGTGDTPCIMITRHPSEFKGGTAIHGVLLRLNTLNHISAARTLCIKTADAVDSRSTNASIDDIFQKYEDEANIYSRTSEKIIDSVSDIIPLIDNKVDMKTQMTLRELHYNESDT